MLSYGITDTIVQLDGHVKHEAEKEEKGKAIKEIYSIPITFILAIGVGFMGYKQFSASLLGGGALFLFAIFLFYVATIMLLRATIDKRVATFMHKRGLLAKANPTPSSITKTKVDQVPPFLLHIYEQNELPQPSFEYNKTVTEDRNILNLKPFSILFFYNFYNSDKEYSKAVSSYSWRRHGTVYFLGSPTDISLYNTFSFDISKMVQSAADNERRNA